MLINNSEILPDTFEYLILHHNRTLQEHIDKYKCFSSEQNRSAQLYTKLEVLVLVMFYISTTLNTDYGNNVWQFFTSVDEGSSIYPKEIINEVKSAMSDLEWIDFKGSFYGLLYGGVYGHENILWPLNSTTYSGRQGLFKIKECGLDHPNELFIKTDKDTSKSGNSLNAFAIVEENFCKENRTDPCFLSHYAQVTNAQVNHATTMISIKIVNQAIRSINLWKSSTTEVNNNHNRNDISNLENLPTSSSIQISIGHLYFANLFVNFINGSQLDDSFDNKPEMDQSICWRLERSRILYSFWLSPQISFHEDSTYFYIWNITYASYNAISNNEWEDDVESKLDILNFVSLCLNGYSFLNLYLELFCFAINELEEIISPYTQTRVQSSKLILFPIGRLYQGEKMNQEEIHFSLIICLPEKYKVYCIEFVKRKNIDNTLYEESAIAEFLQQARCL